MEPEQLIQQGADVSTTYEGGQNELHLEAERGDWEAVEVLLAEGADPNARDDRQRTPLHAALEDLGYEGPGSGGIVGAKFKTMNALLGAGADARAADAKGVTPLHLLVYHATSLPRMIHGDDDLLIFGWLPVACAIDDLVGAGADWDAKDGDGRTPRDAMAGFFF